MTEFRQKLRGSSAQLDATAGLPGLLAVNLSDMSLRLFDGSLTGGYTFLSRSVNDNRYLRLADIGTQNILGGDLRIEEKVSIYGPSSTPRKLHLQSSGSNRFTLGLDAVPEVGSNSGSAFTIERYSDAGALLGETMHVNRATGQITLDNTIIDGFLGTIGGFQSDGPAVINDLLTTETLTTTTLATLQSAVVNTTLGVTGAITAGAVSASGNISAPTGQISGQNIVTPGNVNTGSLTVSGVASVGGTLSANGALNANAGLAVTGAATVSTTLSVTGAVTFLTTLNVTGNITTPGNVVAEDLIADDLVIAQDAFVNRLTMSGVLASTAAINTSAGMTASSFLFSGDPDTGLAPVSANTLRLQTGGVARLTINTATVTSTLPYSGTTITGTTFTGTSLNASSFVRGSEFTFAADTNTGMLNPAADTITWNTNGSEKMRLGSGGGFAVGTTDVTSAFRVAGASSTFIVGFSGAADSFLDGGNFILRTTGGATEKMRVDTSNRLCLGTSVNTYAGAAARQTIRFSGGGTEFGLGLRPDADVTTAITFANAAGANVGSVGITATASTYNTTSDVRMKKNIRPSEYDESLVDQINIVAYDWKADNSHETHGVIAQDLFGVFPGAVKVGDDNDEVESAWGVDYSKLVPLLVHEIQNLRGRVQFLEITH